MQPLAGRVVIAHANRTFLPKKENTPVATTGRTCDGRTCHPHLFTQKGKYASCKPLAGHVVIAHANRTFLPKKENRPNVLRRGIRFIGQDALRRIAAYASVR